MNMYMSVYQHQAALCLFFLCARTHKPIYIYTYIKTNIINSTVPPECSFSLGGNTEITQRGDCCNTHVVTHNATHLRKRDVYM